MWFGFNCIKCINVKNKKGKKESYFSAKFQAYMGTVESEPADTSRHFRVH